MLQAWNVKTFTHGHSRNTYKSIAQKAQGDVLIIGSVYGLWPYF